MSVMNFYLSLSDIISEKRIVDILSTVARYFFVMQKFGSVPSGRKFIVSVIAMSLLKLVGH